MIDHLFTGTDGALYDTRAQDWSRAPLRPVFAWHFRTIESGAQLKATLRAGPYAWPGGYDLYFITSDGGALCFDCVKGNLRPILESVKTGYDDGWRVTACDMESGHLVICDHCGQTIIEEESENV